MYRGNEEVVRADSLQQGEQIACIKWFLKGRLKFSDLVEEIWKKKARLVQKKSDELGKVPGKAIPFEKFLEQLELKKVF
ncbi:MAG: hypothetical protein DRQ41_11725 [Gammaproteobacteria bacterium]|nr:MAG: hypothetical protein DRQ41_11725 [Gammaproteobacteria bacterium]RKZ76144.1 MAG: hypothetical protein DRQ57_04830 [Gammaproteobacteria bacterium]